MKPTFCSRRAAAALALSAAAIVASCSPPLAAAANGTLRVATFNVSLFGRRSGEILQRLSKGDDPQAQHVAEIIQRIRPEILLLNEIDYDPDGKVLAALCDKYLAVPQPASDPSDRVPPAAAGVPSPDQSTGTASGTRETTKPIAYQYRFAAPSNTGVHSGFDLDRNGKVDAELGSRDYGSDCWGFGVYEGQYAFAVLSQHPIDEQAIRTFRTFLWKDMPGAQLPDDPATPAPADWYSAEMLEKFPLSSKNHCDVPIDVRGKRFHLLASHPTPPVFDGPEDHNGRRNHDEIRFWADYVGPADASGYIHDDVAHPGGLATQTDAAQPTLQPPASSLQPAPSFLILGDLNSDPHDGDGGATINQLLTSAAVLKYPLPRSAGAAEQAKLQGGANARHRGDPAEDTEDPADDPGPGNLHLDYILPSANLRVVASGVFWPESSDPLFALVAGAERPASSDHRLVWLDLAW